MPNKHGWFPTNTKGNRRRGLHCLCPPLSYPFSRLSFCCTETMNLLSTYLSTSLPPSLPTYLLICLLIYPSTYASTNLRKTNQPSLPPPLLCTRSQQYTPAFMVPDHGTDCWLACSEGRKEVGKKKKKNRQLPESWNKDSRLYKVTAAY